MLKKLLLTESNKNSAAISCLGNIPIIWGYASGHLGLICRWFDCWRKNNLILLLNLRVPYVQLKLPLSGWTLKCWIHLDSSHLNMKLVTWSIRDVDFNQEYQMVPISSSVVSVRLITSFNSWYQLKNSVLNAHLLPEFSFCQHSFNEANTCS